MGMGSFAVSSFVIGYADLKKLCPKEIAAIEKEQYFKDVGWNSIGQWLAWDDDDQFKENVFEAVEDRDDKKPGRDSCDNDKYEKITETVFSKYEQHIQNLKNAFSKKTGLTLYFDYYDEDSGNRYDEPNDKDGCIFCVDGMVVLSPAGEKYKNIVTERRWTQYG